MLCVQYKHIMGTAYMTCDEPGKLARVTCYVANCTCAFVWSKRNLFFYVANKQHVKNMEKDKDFKFSSYIKSFRVNLYFYRLWNDFRYFVDTLIKEGDIKVTFYYKEDKNFK